MVTTNAFPLMDRLQNALNQPSLLIKCQEITQVLHEVGSKDGISVLKCVVESIFGISNESAKSLQQQQIGGGWGLRIITLSEHRSEYEALRNFLSPNGPLLSLIYRLSQDPFQLFSFPISLLPMKVQNEIKAGVSSPFYTNKIQNQVPGRVPSEIVFDAFEYYVFHFCNFLVGSESQRWNLFWTSVKDSLYPTLLEDYLSTFLPCDASLPPGPSSHPGIPGGILSPIAQRFPNTNQHPSSRPHHPPHLANLSPTAQPNLTYEKSNYYDRASASGFDLSPSGHQLHYLPTMTSPNLGISFWTSQAFIQILMEVWVNLCISPFPSPNLPVSTYGIHLSNSGGASSASPTNLHPSLKDVFVPVGDHVRAVRMMIKHFHYFANSQKPHYPAPLDSIKRNIWCLCRKSMYVFIKHLFTHWPLDSSFRLALETWLSYIQPWRYASDSVRERGLGGGPPEEEDHRSVVDLKWKLFLAENLLFYSHLFSLLLKRILRLDLASPKNTHILYRVAKVFSQGNFLAMITEVESAFEAGQASKSFLGSYGVSSAQETPDEQQQQSPQVLAQVVRSHIADVEKPSYQYLPLFGDAVIKDVCKVVYLTRETLDKLKMEFDCVSGIQNRNRSDSTSVLSSICEFLFEAPKSKELENSVEEMQKCISQLEISMNQLRFLFKLEISESALSSFSAQKSPRKFQNGPSSLKGAQNSQLPDQEVTVTGTTLTDYGRYQMLNGLRRLDLQYEGDPDLRPICTYEVAFLVRLLYALTKLINTKYGDRIKTCYYRNDFVGRICRVVLRSPETVFEPCRNYEVSTYLKKVPVHLPPRVSLRVAAHKKVLLFVGSTYVLMWLCGISFMKATVQILLPFVALLVLVKSACLTKADAPALHPEY